MKDIVANRSLLGLRDKVNIQRLTLRDNGLAYTAWLDIYYTASWLADRAFARTQRLRAEKGIPGINSRSVQREIWESWDWHSQRGEEWTISDDWKLSLITEVLVPNIPQGSEVLEIGPGGGRWTAPLIERAETYAGVDISSECVAICSAEFGGGTNVAFHLGNGRDLAMIPSNSCDRIWSFDTFVHIDTEDARSYVAEFARVLRPDGVGVIHHGSDGGDRGGWRSNLTTLEFHEMLRSSGFGISSSFSEWSDSSDGRTYSVSLYNDVITIFRQPS